MSQKSDQLIANLFGNNNVVTQATAAGSTAAVTVSGVAKSRVTISHLLLSERNVTASDHTTTVSVRDVSIAGTVLVSFDYICLAADSVVINTNFPIPGLVGNNVVVEMGTPVASVTQKVNAAYWIEDYRG